jgi:hypothetical protein
LGQGRPEAAPQGVALREAAGERHDRRVGRVGVAAKLDRSFAHFLDLEKSRSENLLKIRFARSPTIVRMVSPECDRARSSIASASS